MSEVVLHLEISGQEEIDRLLVALDEFALWCDDLAKRRKDECETDFMVTRDHSHSGDRRKLVFANN